MAVNRQELEALADLVGVTYRRSISTAKLMQRVEAAEAALLTVPTIRNVSTRTYTIGRDTIAPGAEYVLNDNPKYNKQVARMVELGVFAWL